MKIDIKCRFSGKILFSHDCEENTVAVTVQAAVSLKANLSSANLRSANLSSADLRSADLRYANLSSANLRSADLRSADLRYANLSSANLRSANLSSADLRSADLRYANLSSANLRSANLRSAKLSSVIQSETTAFFALQCPEEGAFIAWKKLMNGVIAKLLIPEDAKRSSATTRKCRAEFAVVLELFGADEGVSMRAPDFKYRKGETVRPVHSFDEDRWNECASGIHFFLTRAEAESYNA